MLASVYALTGGRHRKPVYKVTRKYDDIRWHWRYVIWHVLVCVSLLGAALYGFARGVAFYPALVPTLYWAGLIFALSIGFIGRSWHACVPLRSRFEVVFRWLASPLLIRPVRLGGFSLLVRLFWLV